MKHQLDIVALQHRVRRVVNLVGLKGVHSLDVVDHDKDAAREHQEERDDAKDADAVEADEDICAPRRQLHDQSISTEEH